jgi:hypothetical protein
MGTGVRGRDNDRAELRENEQPSQVTPIHQTFSCRINDTSGAISAKAIHDAIGRPYRHTSGMSDVATGLDRNLKVRRATRCA